MSDTTMNTTMNIEIAGALAGCAARGWTAVPVHRPNPETGACSCGRADCAKPGKHPDHRFWPDGSATAAHFTGRNVGVKLGPESADLADVDLDCGEAVAAGHTLLPSTSATFGRGGQVAHALYTVSDRTARYAKLQDPVRSGSEATIAELRWPEWDEDERRFKSIQTVLPPSLHRSGATVTWVSEGDPAVVPGADLCAAVRHVGAAVLIARYARPSERHALVLLIANLLARAGWEDDRIAAFAAAVFDARNDPDKAAKVRSGEGAGAAADARKRLQSGKPMTGLPALREMLDPALDARAADAVVAKVKDWLGVPDRTEPVTAAGSTGELEWPEPVPFGSAPPVPEYPLDVLPPVLADWARAVAEELQVPVDLPAALGLGLVAAGIARKVTAAPRPGFAEPTNLYVMAMLPPGERKTQTFRRAIAPVQELQRAAREDAAPVIAAAESALRIADKRVRHLEDKIVKAAPEDRPPLVAELEGARAELARCTVPPAPLFYSEDDTPEALKQELVRQGGRMMVATTEAKCLENITLYADRPNFDVYLKGHAGDEISSGRIDRGRDAVTDPALSCLLAPQPAVAQGLADTGALRGRGFLARWLYQLPASRVGSRRVGAPPVPPAVQAAYEQLVRAAWAIEYADGEPTPLPFDAEAARAFEAFEAWVEPQLAPGGPLARLAGWGNKLNGACARLAAALHVAERLGRGDPWAEPVGADTVARAARLCREYYVPHAVAAFDLMGADTTVSGARRVWAWVAAAGVERFTKRDAFNAHRGSFETVDDLQPCLDLLERHYLIRPRATPDAPRGRGRPTSPVYDVNPKADRAAAPATEPTAADRPVPVAPAPEPVVGAAASGAPAGDPEYPFEELL